MDRDSMGNLNQPSQSLPKKQGPLSRSAREEQTFGKPDAYALAQRLARTWVFLAEEGRAEGLVEEFIAQFDGCDPAMVDEAATRAIGKSGKQPPTAGEIKAEWRALRSLSTAPQQAPTTNYGYRPWYDYSSLPESIVNAPDSLLGNARRLMGQGCSPDYIKFRERERELMRETIAKMKAMPPEKYNKLYGGFADKFKPLPHREIPKAPEGVSDLSDSLRDVMARKAA